MKTTSAILLILLSLFALTCKRNNPLTPPDTTFALTADDVSCTEVYLGLKLGSGNTSRSVTLKRDSITLFTKTINATDTVLADTGLTPNHTFTYVAMLAGETQQCRATTMDTTSHNWTWQMFTLGGAASSALFDVAIINGTLAYAVGQMYLNDSTGQVDQQPYNLAIWNGHSWKLQKLFADGFPPAIKSVFVNNENDVWFDPWFHWDGQSFQENPSDSIFFGIGIGKMWGNSNGFYVVGTAGFIAHRNSSGNWTKIESGTTLDMLDIYGSGSEILAVASDNNPYGEAIISISGNTATQIFSFPLGQDELYGVWFVPNRHYYVVGDGIYEKHLLSESTWKNGTLDITQYATTKVKGNGLNDVMVVGAYGEVLHWNGVSWRSYRDITGLNGSYTSVAVDGNFVIAVGQNDTQAVVAIGRR